jgi:hypothetical protein
LFKIVFAWPRFETGSSQIDARSVTDGTRLLGTKALQNRDFRDYETWKKGYRKGRMKEEGKKEAKGRESHEYCISS